LEQNALNVKVGLNIIKAKIMNPVSGIRITPKSEIEVTFNIILHDQ